MIGFSVSIVFSFFPSSSSYFFPSVLSFLVSFPSLMMNRAHGSKIWKKHLFFLCTELPIVKYNCLIDYRRSANDVVQNIDQHQISRSNGIGRECEGKILVYSCFDIRNMRPTLVTTSSFLFVFNDIFSTATIINKAVVFHYG